MLATEFTYELAQPFSYANSGQQVESTSITVKAPNNKVITEIAMIESEFNKAQFSAMGAFKNVVGEAAFQDIIDKKPESESKESEVKPVDVITQMLAGGADMAKCYIALGVILASGSKGHETALIDNIIQVTKPIFESMHPHDTKMLLGNYIVNFIHTSPKA